MFLSQQPRKTNSLQLFYSLALLIATCLTSTWATASSTSSTPSFTLTASVSSLSLVIGYNNPVEISVKNANGLAGKVSLAASGVPSGITATFATVNSTTTSLTFTVSKTASTGTYPVTVTGTSGKATSSVSIPLTIPQQGFSLSASVSNMTLLVGGPAGITSIVVTDQNGFTGNVNLAVSGLPSGVTAVFGTPSAQYKSALTLTPGVTAAPGVYAVKVTGTSGTLVSTTTLTLTIPQPSFGLSSSPSALALLAGGGSANSSISVANPVGLASSNVNLAVSGVPAGVTAKFSWYIACASSPVTLAFTASSAAIPGKYTVTVTGISGAATSTTPIVLTISQPGFSLAASPSSLSLIAGGSAATSSITVNGQSGFSGKVNLTATGLPSGATAAFSSASTSAQSTLAITAGVSAAPGAYTVTVTGTSGAVTASMKITLTIQASTFSLSSTPGSLALVAGGQSVSTTIGVTGLSGSSSVALTAAGVPTGVTAAFSPATTSTTSALAFTASSTAAVGTYTITVTGTSGSAKSTANIQLTVQAPKAAGPISVAIAQPTYGFNVLPGSVRRIFATVTNGVTNSVSWSVTGGATLSSTAGNWVDVTAPATGSSCSINGTQNYTIASATHFTLTAQSVESPGKANSITLNVCNPAVQVHVVPFYTTVYSGQKADIQAFIWGSVNRNVTWKITSEPINGDGALTDAANQDTAFAATVAGRYILTATSVADGSKANTATVYVTGHSMPYQVTPSETLPVDCSVDPSLTGTTYNVGPSQPYKTIQSVPWASLKPGSTVRIHNEDTAGGNPTTYHEYFQLTTQATRTQPVRVCGVPDSRGNLPVVDASNSTGSSTVSSYSAGYAAVGIGATAWAGLYNGTWTGPQYLIVEGLKIQNAKPPSTFTTPAGAAGTPWINGSACVRLFRSMDTVVRGIDANNCGNGFFSDFNANNGYAAVVNTLYEGNHLHNNGNSGSYTQHQFYIQGWNEVVQFNLVDEYQSGAEGSNFKGRGFPEIIRYNHFGDGAARQLDLVDNQDGAAYTSFEGYLAGGASSYRAIYPADAYTADLLAAAVEAHHADYVYGNTFVNSTSVVPIHYATDMEIPDNNRLGTLWFYNNSFYESAGNSYSWHLFDTSAGGGSSSFPEVEWPQIMVQNNAFWMDSPTAPYFAWNGWQTQFTTFGKNVINSNWGSDNMAGGFGTGWASNTSDYAFQGNGNSADVAGVSNLIGVSKEPFDLTSFAPNAQLVNAGAALPASGPKLPVRFQYGPTATQVVREQPFTVGAME